MASTITPTKSPDRPARRTRRVLARVLVAGIALLVLLVLGFAGLAATLYTRADVSTVDRLGFANQLKIPPLLQPRLDGSGRKVFDLRLQQGTSELLAGRPAQTWGANGAYLGPTLRASRGDRVAVNVANQLPEATTIHWHGMHLPAAADGGPHQMIAPGATWSPGWTIDQPAATLWYHPHPHGVTAEHVYRGVAGLFLLDDPQAGALALPDRYGVDDIPIVLQDKRFDGAGRLDFDQQPFSPVGRLGGQILVNGTHDPHLAVTSQRVRLRLLNASTARVYHLGFADNRPVELVGTDGGLLDAPRRVRRVQLSPGERAEVVASFRPGERPVLRSFQPDLGLDAFEGRFAGADDTFDLLQVRAAAKLAASPAVPDRLASPERLDSGAVVNTRRFQLEGSSRINGREMDLGRIDQAVTIGTTEIWEVANQSGNPHNFHVHDVQFKVLDYREAPRPPTLDGWKDTVFVPPGASARLLVRFSDYTDPALPYMFHCHILRHEDNGMMGQFVVVQPGQAPASLSHQHGS
jgi:FtsP/CotA-like multicopper oxidase with cupredoxin domain